jgi:nucleoside-diphosphate-sugar epimerase
MNILITGGCGFLGARLARTLLQAGKLSLAGAPAAPSTVTLTDRAEPPADLRADPRVRFVGGDLLELVTSRQLPAAGTDAIFHLAAAVSGECEADFDLGMRSNFATTHALLEAAAPWASKPVLVFASSLAVFGKQPGQPMPDPIRDDTLPTPQSSYGIQKFIGEQLTADYTRKGFVRGRSVRLMTVSVRAGRPNGAASGFLSGMCASRWPASARWCRSRPLCRSRWRRRPAPSKASSAPRRRPSADWGSLTGLNLPSILTTVGEMAAALEAVAGPQATALLDWKPDPAIEKLVSTWPGNVRWDRAGGLGLKPDASFEQVVRDYVRENPEAVQLKLR